MKKAFMFLGTILIAAVILISGSVVAPCTWVYVITVTESGNTTDTNEILDIDDGVHITLGQGPSTLGYVIVDLGSSNAMPANQEFSVNASFGGQTEDYSVSVSENLVVDVPVGTGDDSGDTTFDTPSTGSAWRYIILTGTSGSTSGSDPIYGPELDAVGWCK